MYPPNDTRRSAAAFVAFAIICAALFGLMNGARAADAGKVRIVTASGTIEFVVEVAATQISRARGLMFRRSLDPGAGMLFDYGYDKLVQFWMKDTYIPLDMLFIKSDGRISSIAHRAVPHSRTIIPSQGLVRAVLELNGGTAERLGIRAGDRVLHPIFR